jgi:hypothetical protein
MQNLHQVQNLHKYYFSCQNHTFRKI